MLFREVDLLDSDHLKHKEEKGTIIIRVLYILLLTILLFGNGAAYVEIETIIISAGLVLVVASALFVVSLIQRNRKAVAFSIYGLCFVIAFFLLIYLFELSPNEAERKILVPMTFVNVPVIVFWCLILRKIGKPKIYD